MINYKFSIQRPSIVKEIAKNTDVDGAVPDVNRYFS